MENENCYAVYARTSKETDDAFSVSSQVDAALEYARSRGFYVPEEYIFREDYSGKEFDRPCYSKIRELVRGRKICGLIIYATDRFARRVSVGELYLDELIKYGVALHNVSWGQAVRDTPEDRVRFNIETTFSSFEREKIIERVMRGKHKKARSGKIVAHARPPFGYNFNEYKNGFVLNEHAPIVKELLETYAHTNKPLREILMDFNRRGIPTPGTLRADHHEKVAKRMLEAELITQEQYDQKIKAAQQYRGFSVWSFQTVATILDHLETYTGTYRTRLQGVEYLAEVPPIISKDTAEAIMRKRSSNRARFSRKRAKGSECFLMARRLTCSIHGHSFLPRASTSSRYIAGYYSCGSNKTSSAINAGVPPCKIKPIRQDDLDPHVRQFIRDLLLNPEALFHWWEEQNKLNQRENSKVLEEIETVNHKIIDVENKYYRTLDRLTDRLEPEERAYYEKRRDQLLKEIHEYKELRKQLEGSIVKVTEAPDIVRTLHDMGNEYRELLETSFSLPFWRGLVEDLDLLGEIGEDETGTYIDFILFDEKRVRRYIRRTALKRGPKLPGDPKPFDEEHIEILYNEYDDNLFSRGSRTRAGRFFREGFATAAAAAC